MDERTPANANPRGEGGRKLREGTHVVSGTPTRG